MTTSPIASRLTGALLVPVAALLLVGCGSIQEAVDGAQGALDSAQSLLGAPEQIGQACDTALAALAPGQSPAEARAALDDATAQFDAALGGATALPGISDVREALVTAAESVAAGSDAAALEPVRTALATACLAIPGS